MLRSALVIVLFMVIPRLPMNGQPSVAVRANSLTEPKILATFDAIAGDPGMSYKDHPDMALAACSACGGAGQILVATGQKVAVYDTLGHLLKTQNTRDFIKASGMDPDAWLSRPALPASAAGRVNDPRATYDPFIERWIVVCSCSADYLIVSGSRDATGSWKGAVLSDSSGDLTMFPGWDKNGVYVSEFQPPLNSRVIALPAAEVAWKGDGPLSFAHKAIFTNRPYEMRPAIDSNRKKARAEPEYLIARTGPPQNATNYPMDLIVDKITWTGNTASLSGPSTIQTGFLYNTPIPAPQPSGTGLRGNESHRIFSVSAHAGHLYVVEASGPCTSECGTQGADTNNLFYWFDIAAKTLTLNQKAKVSHPSLSWLFPTLASDDRGNVGIAATGTSSTQSPSVYLFTHVASDSASGKINGPFLAHAGTTSYSCDKGQSRPPNPAGWGTYSATVQDGSDPTILWTLQEYAGSETPCVWQTRVVGFRIATAK